MSEMTVRSLSDVLASIEAGPYPEALRPNPLGLPRPATVPIPAALMGARGRRVVRRQVSPFVKLTGEARRQAALPTLRAALAAVRTGWCQGAMHDGTGRVSLYGAVATGGVEAEYAREVLRDVLREWDVVAWNDHPARRKAEVVTALQRAIALAGRHVARGGWRCAR